jgi:hypothetical protein
MKKIFTSIFLFYSIVIYSAVFTIGPTKNYVSPNALYIANVVQDGDTIYIDAGKYIGQASLAIWSKKNLFIKGIGESPKMIADGKYILGKGIWVCGGNNISIENISFSGAKVPDQNGAGIRLDGVGLTIRQCHFQDNENGILTSNPYDGDITIEFSVFDRNGYGDGFSHNLYIGHVNKLIFRFNYSHHAKIGHNLKSRAKENYIAYNRIMDEETGNSSRLIDISNGGYAMILGNLLMQGPNAENNNLIGYGKEGLNAAVKNEIYVINNTMVNKRTASCIFIDINDGVRESKVSNNIFWGTGIVSKGKVNEMKNNLVENDITKLFFKDESMFDYRLTDLSPAIDKGTISINSNGNSIKLDSVYKHIANFNTRNLFNQIDIGAYEFESLTSVKELTQSMDWVYPNPTNGEVNIPPFYEILDVKNSLGSSLPFDKINFNVFHLNSGIYYIFSKYNEKIVVLKIIKI